MHVNAKKRIEQAKKGKDTRPALTLPKTKGRIYETFKGAVGRLCDDVLASPELTEEERTKVAWLRSRIEIEM